MINDVPITYIPNFINYADNVFETLRTKLDWVRHDNVPRMEYYCNDFNRPYVYGVGKGQREYHPQPYHWQIHRIREKIEDHISAKLEVCFLNRYLTQKDHLGWHADDSPEMDDNRPIAIVSLGVERDIWFCPQLDKSDVTKLKLEHGSLCLMLPHMQENWFHRIPKASFECGERISLTYRGYNQ